VKQRELPPDRDACSFSNDKPFPIFDALQPSSKVNRPNFWSLYDPFAERLAYSQAED
jgi:hypothetical protein